MDQRSTIKGLIGIVIAGVIIFSIVKLQSGQQGGQTATSSVPVATKETGGSVSSTTTVTTTTTTVSGNTSPYKDGTYSSVGSYQSPAGFESVKVTVTLKDGIITDSTVVSQANDPESAQYQGRFISGYNQYVIGKNIADVSLSRVSGSSLTSGGFNSALAKIKVQAQA